MSKVRSYRKVEKSTFSYEKFKSEKILSSPPINPKRIRYLVCKSLFSIIAYAGLIFIIDNFIFKCIMGSLLSWSLACSYFGAKRYVSEKEQMKMDPVSYFYKSPEFLWDDETYLYYISLTEDSDIPREKNTLSDYLLCILEFSPEEVSESDFYKYERRKMFRSFHLFNEKQNIISTYDDVARDLICDRCKAGDHEFFASKTPKELFL